MYAQAPLAAGMVLMLFAGCAAPDRRDLDHRAGKVEGERDQLQLALDDERAKVAILQERLESERQGADLARTEASTQRDHASRLERANEQLQDLLQRQTQAALASPQVSATPLPPEIDRQLQAFVGRHAGRIWYDRGRAAVSFADDRLFEPGGDAVRAGARSVLNELAGIAAQTPATDFELIVVGHTDDTPISSEPALAKHASNWHLSVHRAIAVKNVLVAAGLPEARMGVMGYGPCRPLGADKARNRRVEVFFARRGEIRPAAPIRSPAPP